MAAQRRSSGRRASRARGLEIIPLTPDRWDDFAALFGARGACGGCWCMWWRRSHAEYEAAKGAKNRAAMKRIVGRGEPPGLIAYRGGEPVGWCAVAPREVYIRLERSRILKPVDDTPAWSVVCFFVTRAARGQGVSVALLRAAVDYAKARGAQVVEGYPVEPKKGALPAAFAYTGLASAFIAAGFREVARRSAGRPIMRVDLG